MNTWGVRGTLAAVGVAAVIAGIGGAAVYGASAEGPRMMGPPRGGPSAGLDHRPGQGARSSSWLLHGESVTDGPGGVVTRLTQMGRLTALTPTSVTVRSADDFTSTYALPTGAPGPSLSVGDEVEVTATREGEAAVIESIDPTARPPLASAD
ncbi:hypothetical protein [Mycolicibacterium sediminis]|uniref:DUF5666 domain-containing protein n=1 Tax=Mycolicibacterium sediminis TaxID=1286180 RepID=A0A7I7QXU8_9MYCO|nr:hypothetical protein [Mycolicibacterium sediminis]BBY31158.1 hypothetical protein MSEDJ_52540 [Mycolicibacterium sediminis]